ncbi:MAG TPA: hypothetical protein VGU19_10260 [Microvirga sp.]|jgi:hypothetical protein|nr:hypothetical protein [Microvirga sp.]
MSDRTNATRELLVKNASLKSWLCVIFGLPWFAYLTQDSFKLLDPKWQPSSRRMAFVHDWPPELRTALFFGVLLLFCFGLLMILRFLLEPYRARLSSSGVELPTPLGRERLSWDEVTRISVQADGLRLTTSKPGLFGPRVVGYPTTGVSPGRDEILGVVAHFRPDLMPNIVPVQPKATPEENPPEPQQPIVIDSRGWTG